MVYITYPMNISYNRRSYRSQMAIGAQDDWRRRARRCGDDVMTMRTYLLAGQHPRHDSDTSTGETPLSHEATTKEPWYSSSCKAWYLLGFESQEAMEAFQDRRDKETKRIQQDPTRLIERKPYKTRYTHPAHEAFMSLNTLCPRGKEYVRVDYFATETRVGLLEPLKKLSATLESQQARVFEKHARKEQEGRLITAKTFQEKERIASRLNRLHLSKIYLYLNQFGNNDLHNEEEQRQWFNERNLRWRMYAYVDDRPAWSIWRSHVWTFEG